MRAVWLKEERITFDGKMLWAAAALCFLQSGEIAIPSDSAFDEGAHLGFNDVTVDCLCHPQILRVCFKNGCLQSWHQHIIILFVGRANNRLCAVTAALSYMVERGAGAGPFFKFQDGCPLTRARFVMKVKEALTIAGIDCTVYSGHSLRSGAATTAAKQGISDAAIEMLGRWKSSAYQLYKDPTGTTGCLLSDS